MGRRKAGTKSGTSGKQGLGKNQTCQTSKQDCDMAENGNRGSVIS